MLPLLLPMVAKNWKLFAILGALIAVISMVGLAYWHYTGLIDEVSTLKTRAATLELEKEIQAGHITQLGEGIEAFKENEERIQKKINELATVATEAKKETRRLNALFSKHDLSRLAAAKPGLMEKRFNSGTVTVLRLLECETGNASKCGDSKAKH
jgi:hypothetical protein